MSAGVIILITSAGGTFGQMLQQTNMDEDIGSLAQRYRAAILPLAFLIAVVILTAQGCATVAMVTAIGVTSGARWKWWAGLSSGVPRDRNRLWIKNISMDERQSFLNHYKDGSNGVEGDDPVFLLFTYRNGIAGLLIVMILPTLFPLA